jgi:hypothetical protein
MKTDDINLQENTEDTTLTVEELLKNVSLQELRDFVVRQAQYNTNLTGAVKLEFAHKANGKTGEVINPYSSIIREIMEDVDFDYYNYRESEESLNLDMWFEKARVYVLEHNYHEAVLICKACIEEFAEWMYNEKTDITDCINYSYQIVPFEIIEKAVASPAAGSKSLYDYCLSEMNKDKYSGTEMFDKFNDLLALLAVKINACEFIEFQDSLLSKIDDNASHEAEKILQREIDFYNKTQQPQKANAIIEKNIQIEKFRYQVVEKRFEEQNYAEAKRLIDDFIQERRDAGRDYASHWDELLLEIAQKENNTPDIRIIAFSFIEKKFVEKYFDIYKSTYTSDEWKDALENLLQHYKKNTCDFDIRTLKSSNFSSAAADVLVAENAAKRLMLYVENNLTVERIEKYYTTFVDLYPEKTLELFRKAIDAYVVKNVARNYYEHVAKLLEQMRKVKNGEKTVSETVACYRIKYKNRRVMMEILSSF